jgi:uncharacterized membrane protein HdeD (DUF308 family)
MVDIRAVDVLARNWWIVGLRGLVAVIFGLLTLLNPAITLAVLILLFGAYALVYGLFMAITAVAHRRGEPSWGILVAGGILSILLGVLTFLMPGITALALLYLIAAWAIVVGIAEIVAGIRLRREITGEWLLILGGVLSVVFGVFLAIFPGAGALALTLWIGAWALVLGILLIALAFRLRSWRRDRGGERALGTA